MKTYLEMSEMETLEETAWYLRDKLLIRLLRNLGCRISEALGISVEDIDFSTGAVRIQHLKSRTSLHCPNCKARLRKTHTFCPGCGMEVEQAVRKATEHRRMRTIPIDQGTLDMVREYIDRGGTTRRNGNEYLFTLTRNHAWRIVRDLAIQAGLPRITDARTGRVHNVSPHKLRDGFAVRATRIDASSHGLRMLQEMLGHENFNTTAKYWKVGGSELDNWYRQVVETAREPASSPGI